MNRIKTNNLKKRGQTLSIDSYIAIALFLTTVITFFSFVNLKGAQDSLTGKTDILVHRLRESQIFEDGILTEAEEARLVRMDCSQIKDVFESKVDLCIYLRDSQRKIVPLTDGNITKYGVGCEGILLSNEKCGTKV
ncbi:MAG: hypothetical protein ACQESF_04705 [Nanobdellota archaeon]